MNGIESLCGSFDNETSAEVVSGCVPFYFSRQVFLLDELVLV